MAYLKPQSPIKNGQDHIYPLTTYDQIIMPDGSRWNGESVGGSNKEWLDVNLEGATEGELALTNADMLGNVPAAEYALKTDTAPDSVLLGGKAPEYYIQPVNLLDNSDFTNPVNQQGQTEYSATKDLTIDRWKASNAAVTVSINNGYLSLSNSDTSLRRGLYQRLTKNYIGKSLTVAVCDADSGNIFCETAIVPEPSESTQYFCQANFNGHSVRMELYSGGSLNFSILVATQGSCNLLWVALYEGAYTAETLPPYMPKGYAAELAECQRYYYEVKAKAKTCAYINGSCYTDTEARFALYLPQEMRVTPTFTYEAGYLVVAQNNTYQAVTALNLLDITGNYALISATTTGLTAKGTACLVMNQTTLKFSAVL